MGRKKDKETSSEAQDSRLVSALRKVAVGFGIAAGLVLTGYATHRLYGYVDRTVALVPDSPKVVLANRPVWMGDFLADQLCGLARPPGGYSALNSQVLKTVKARLEGNVRANAYIKQIRELKLVYGNRPGDTLILDCEFRAPVALLHYQDRYYMVDGDGFYLPENYSADQVSKVVFGTDGRLNMRIVEGIKSGPPMPGAKWDGEDVVAAIDMVKVLGDARNRGYTEEIIKVDVSNFAKRQDEREAQIVLFTKQNTQIRWGMPVTSTDFLAEVPSGQKLERIKQLHSKTGRPDGGLSWVDLRKDLIEYPRDEMQAASRIK
jgi:hypothetical protein